MLYSLLLGYRLFTSSAKGKAINPGCAAVQCRDGEKRALLFETTALKDKSQKNDNAAVVDKLCLLFVVPGVVVVARLLMLGAPRVCVCDLKKSVPTAF
jgi:hypothetical protein